MAKKSGGGLYLVFLVCLSLETRAYGATTTRALLAYADPGSGALLLQFLTMAGLMVAFYFSRARNWLAKRLGIKNTDVEQKEADNSDHSVTHDS